MKSQVLEEIQALLHNVADVAIMGITKKPCDRKIAMWKKGVERGSRGAAREDGRVAVLKANETTRN